MERQIYKEIVVFCKKFRYTGERNVQEGKI